MQIRYFFLIFGLIAFSSCEEVVIIDTNFKEQIVANSIFSENPMEVEVTKSFVVDDFRNISLDQAHVLLFENNVEKDVFVYHQNREDRIGKFISSYIPKAGKSYYIEISDPDLGKAKSDVSIIPEKLNFVNSTVTPVPWQDAKAQSRRYKFSFNVDKAITDDDYFYLKIFMPLLKWDNSVDSFLFLQNQRAEIIVPDIINSKTYLENALIFSGKSIVESSKKISGNATLLVGPQLFSYSDQDSFFQDTTRLHIELHHVSEALYKFYYSYATKIAAQDDVFATEASIYSNIQNGYGIFGGENITLEKVKITY